MTIKLKYFKLITGEEIVTGCEEQGDFYVLSMPAQVEKKVADDSMFMVKPFVNNVKDNKIFINKRKILYEGTPVDSLKQYYTKNYIDIYEDTNEN